MPKTFSTAKTSSDDGVKWEDELPYAMVDIRSIAKGEYHGIRLVGYIEPFMRFWVPTEASKAYDPYKLGAKQYPSVCVDFDPEEEVFTGNECLYRKAHYKYIDEKGEEKWGKLKPSKSYVIFFIDRERQEERSGISLKKKYRESQKMSDIQCATVPTAFAREVQGAIEMFAKKNKGKSVDPTDPDEGYDLYFKFDGEAKAEAKYKIQLGDSAPLTKEERKQLELLPDGINIYPKDSIEKIRSSLDNAGYVLCEKGEEPADVIAAAKKTSKKSSTMKAGAELLDDDNADDGGGKAETRAAARKAATEDSFKDEDNDLNLDGDEQSAGTSDKGSSESKAKAAAAVEDDDFNFDDDEF